MVTKVSVRGTNTTCGDSLAVIGDSLAVIPQPSHHAKVNGDDNNFDDNGDDDDHDDDNDDDDHDNHS